VAVMRKRLFMHKALLLAVCTALALLLQSSRVRAEPAGYRSAIDEAISEFAAHRFDEARTLFLRAHGIFPNARTLRGLGLADFELRDYVACVQHLDAALRSDVRPLEQELRTETEALRARAAGFVGRLTLRAQPEASRLLVDGAQADWPVAPLLLSFGTHTLELFAAGYEPERRSLLMAGGEERTLDVVFQHPHAARADASSHDEHWYQSPWLWVAVGVVVVAGATTAVVLATRPEPTPEPLLGGTSGVVIPGT
jgi:hypothetical protein